MEAAAEEESFNDIQLLMELLTNLLSKDFIDLSPPGMIFNTVVVFLHVGILEKIYF